MHIRKKPRYVWVVHAGWFVMIGALDEYENRKDKSPPFQPVLYSKTQNYAAKVLQWHPVAVKKDVLFYQFQASADEDACTIELLPDACINILFECCPDDPGVILSGLQTRAQEIQLKPGVRYFGFKPYSEGGLSFKELDLTELVGDSVDLLELLPDAERLLQQLACTDDLNEQIRLFGEFARSCLIDHDYQPNFVDFFAMLLCTQRGSADLTEIQKMTGYSMRYCRERFKGKIGISPKQYNNIMRFQSTLKQLMNTEEPHMSLTALAANNGYFDQAHFIHDFKRFTDMSPGQFRNKNLKPGMLSGTEEET